MVKSMLKRKDFECYEVLLPFSSITGKRRKRYLCSELEKRHPCFSDEFAYDLVLKKLCRKGIQTDVYVMNKLKLAEYERNRSFAGSGFFVKKDSGWYSRCFVDKKWKLCCWTIIACVIVGLTGAVCGGLAASEYEKESGLTENEETRLPSETVLSEVTDGTEDGKTLIAFFQTVSEGKGKISHFEWKLQGFTQEMNASVGGIFPESLPDNIRGESVVYENSLPQMKVSYTGRAAGQSEKSLELKSPADNSVFSAAVRSLAIENGAYLLEEKSEPYHLEFICNCEVLSDIEKTRKLFDSLTDLLAENRRTITSLMIKQMKASELRIGFTAETLSISAFDLSLISDNLQLFLPERKPPEKSVQKISSKTEAVLTQNSIQGKKLGEIKRADKTSVVFFKNSEGKIQKIIEKVEEEK